MTSATASAPDEKRIVLGGVHCTIVLPGGVELGVKRMPISSEVIFTDIYRDMVKIVQDTKTEILGKMLSQLPQPAAVQTGGKRSKGEDAAAAAAAIDPASISIPILDTLTIFGDVLAKLPEFQAVLLRAVKAILEAHKCNINGKLEDLFATADLIAIVKAQAEVQGILTSFREFMPGLGSGIQE